MYAESSHREFLEALEKGQIHKPVIDIGIGTMFLGNPIYPCGPWPARSAAMGEGIWVRTPNGLASLEKTGYDGQAIMDGWIIEGYLPVDADLLKSLTKLKRDFSNLLFISNSYMHLRTVR